MAEPQATNLASPASAPTEVAPDAALDDVAGAPATPSLQAPPELTTTTPADKYAEDGELSTFQNIGQAPLLPPREPIGARLAAIMGRHHALLLTLCVVLLWLITTLPVSWLGEAVQPGQIATHDILAPRDLTVPLLDRAEIAARREEAANLVPPVYNPNPAAQAQALAALYSIIALARHSAVANVTAETANAPHPPLAPGPKRGATLPPRASATPTAPALSAQAVQAARLSRFNARLPKKLPAPLALRLLSLRAERWEPLERAIVNAIHAVYKGGQLRSDVMKDDDAAASGRIEAAMQRQARQRGNAVSGMANLTLEETKAGTALARYVADQPNLVVDERKTARAREEAESAVHDLYQRIKADTVIVKAGEPITAEKWGQLQAMNLVQTRLDPKLALARFAFCLALIAFAANYIVHFHRSLIERPAALWLAAMVPVAFLAVFRQMLRVPHADLAMVPMAATSAMLLTILLNARVGIVVGFVVSALSALMARADMSLFLVTVLSSWIGVLSVTDISSRGQLLVRAPLLLAMTNGVLAAAWGAMREAPPDEIISVALFGAVAGVLSVIATAALAMSLERPFGITTHLRLLELLAPDELVTRRMQAEAPGTYTHSLMVAMLSEAAAKAVGADPLLCRVGGLYHDIGKLRRPHCFVENQAGENIHDKLSPQLSALIILAHVKDGIELGRALRVPQPIIDIITQHHGTTLVSYFYQRALAQCGANGASSGDTAGATSALPTTSGNALPAESAFRYAGPRPQTKEAAIVLLADTIEASSRSLPNLTQERLETHIKAMIAQRLQDGELSECELTLRDLGTIETSFIHVLRGVLHQRIEYPEPGREFNSDDKEDGRGWVRNTLARPAVPGKAKPPGVDQRRQPRSDRRRKPERKNNAASYPAPRPAPAAVANGAAQGHKKSYQNGNGIYDDQASPHPTQSYDSARASFSDTPSHPHSTSLPASTDQRDLDTPGPRRDEERGTNGHANGYTNGHTNGRLKRQHSNGATTAEPQSDNADEAALAQSALESRNA